MRKEKLKATPKRVVASVLALGAGTALAIGLFNGGGTLAAWNSGVQLSLNSTIQIDWDDPTPPTITTESLEAGFIDEAYSFALEGEGSGIHSVSAGALPDGLTLDPKNGSITGTPTKKGVFTFTVTKTNKVGEFSKEFSIEIAYSVPTITTETLEVARKGVLYTQQIQGKGGGATYSVSSEALPNGLSLDSATGTISGTATATGSYPIIVTKTNESGSVQKSYELEVKLTIPKFLNGAQLWSGNLNVPYNRTLSVEGEEVVFTSSDLPAWLSLNTATGALTGTPPEMKSYYFNVTASNSGGSASKQFYIAVNDTPPIFTTETLADGEVGIAYNGKVELLQANASFVSAGGLPSGLSFNRATGEITGTPRFSGTFDVTFNATRDYITASKTISIFIETDGPTITTKELPDAVQNTSYYQILSGKGENSTYQISSGTLPGSLSLDPTLGRISGQPGNVAHGLYTFTITKTNEKGVASKELSIYVRYQTPTLTTWNLASATVGRSYTSNAPTGVGNGSTYSISQGRLPNGITLNEANGVLSGQSTEEGAFPIALKKVNESGSVEISRTLNVNYQIPVLLTKSIPDATVGVPFTFQIEATGDGITYGSDFPLPEGFSINENTGVLSGYSDNLDSKFIRIFAKNSGGSATYSQTFRIVDVPPVYTVDARLPNAIVGTPYSFKLEASGKNLSYSFPQGGSFAAGLKLDTQTGIISGTPTTPEANRGTQVAVSNSGGRDSKIFYMSVVTQAPTITQDSNLPSGVGGQQYSITISGEGTGNTWSVSSGALPKGLSMSSANGTILGTPTEFGTFNFTLTKANASGTVTKDFTLRIGYEVPTIDTANSSPYVATLGGIQSVNFAQGNGYGSTYSISNGALPDGLTLDAATAKLGGKTTKVGTFVFTLLKGNPESSVSKEFTFVVNDVAPTLPSTPTSVTIIEGTQTSIDLGGTGSNVTYSLVKDSTLPAGLVLDPTTGRITGITTEVGTRDIYISKTNSGGTAEKKLTISVVYAKPVMETTSLPAATVGVPYSAFVYASGKGVTYSISGSITLPAGLSLNPATGEISGTPTTKQSRTVSFVATNNGGTSSRGIQIVVG